MDLTHLAVVEALAKAGSVSRAADWLMVSQPAVSKQLKQIERAAGVQLFDRLPKGVRPTQAGELLAGYARRIAALQAEAVEALDELRGLHRGRLAVGSSTTIGVYLLPELFVTLRQSHPNIQISLELSNARGVERRLLDGTIDVGFTEVPVEAQAFETHAFREDRLVAIAHPAHPLASHTSVTAAALSKEPFVVHEPSSAAKSQAERALAEMGLAITPAMTLGSTEAIKRAVAGGVGVALVPQLTIALELRAGTLAMLNVTDLCIRRPLYRVHARGRHRSAAVKAFEAMLDEPDAPSIRSGMKGR